MLKRTTPEVLEGINALELVEADFEIVKESLDLRLSNSAYVPAKLANIERARSQCEKTYLLRLLAEFEGVLGRVGPSLNRSVTFVNDDGLSKRLNTIGKNMGMDKEFRKACDEKIRGLRNELAHGRSEIPGVTFDSTHELMKEFLRWCY